MRSAPTAFMAARRYSFSAAATRLTSAGATSRYTRRGEGGAMGGAAVWPNAGESGSSNETAITKRNIRSLRFDACEYTQVRLFVAVEIGERLARRAAKLTEELERRPTAAARGASPPLLPRHRLHLAIWFSGGVDEGKSSMVRQALEEPLAVAPFSLTLCGVGTFPKSGTPRVVWLGITEGREELLRVEREITARLTPLGIPEEERAYSPHLTLARVRAPAGLKPPRLLVVCTV